MMEEVWHKLLHTCDSEKNENNNFTNNGTHFQNITDNSMSILRWDHLEIIFIRGKMLNILVRNFAEGPLSWDTLSPTRFIITNAQNMIDNIADKSYRVLYHAGKVRNKPVISHESWPMKLSYKFSKQIRDVACTKDKHWFNNWVVWCNFENITSNKTKTNSHQCSAARYNKELSLVWLRHSDNIVVW